MANPSRLFLASLSVLVAVGLPTAAAAQMGSPGMGMGMGEASARDLGEIGATSLESKSGIFVTDTCVQLGGLGAGGRADAGPDTEELFELCSDLVVEGRPDTVDEDDLNDALEDLSHAQAAAAATASTQTSIRNMETIAARMFALREGGPAIQFAGLDLRDQYGGTLHGEDIERALREASAAGNAPLLPKWGIWGNGIYGWGDYSGRTEETGFDFDAWGGIVGADYRLTNEFVAGLAFSYANVDNDYDGGQGDLERDAWGISAYGSYQTEHFFVDAIAHYTYLDMELERRIFYPGVNRTAKSDPDGDQWGVSVTGGASFNQGALGIDPYVRVTYIGADIDGARESGAGGLNLDYDDQSITSVTTDVGAILRYAVSTSFGVVTPYVRAEYEHEFENDARTISARFVNDPNGNQLRLRAKSPDRDVMNVGGGVSVSLANGVTAFVDFDSRLADSFVDAYAVTVGGRVDF